MPKSMNEILRAFEAELDRAGLQRSPIFFDPKSDSLEDDEGLRFLTVRQSRAVARELEGLVPFATDGAGNYVCVEAKSGRVVDWDHETKKTRKLAASLETYARAATRALKKRGSLGASGSPKAKKDPKTEVISKLYDDALDKKDPAARKKTIAVMNDPRAMGTDKHDDDWLLDRLIDILVQARRFAALRHAAPFAERVLKIAKKRGVEADARRALS